MLGDRYKMDGETIVELSELQKVAKREFLEDFAKEDSSYKMEFYPCECGAGEADFEVLAEKDRYGLPVRTVICKKCGLVMTNPRMTQESYDNFYANSFAGIYRGDEGMGDIGERFDGQRKRGHRIADFVEQYANREIKSVLEIGCAAGGILSAFKERGYEVTGVDLDDEYLEYGRSQGLDLRLGHSSELLQEGKRYDLIILCHVFEHFLDIESEVNVIRDLLTENGVVYIEVPGLKVLEIGQYDGDFLLYLQNAHVRSFTLGTLSNVMKKYGFELHVGNPLVQALFTYTGACSLPTENHYEKNMDMLLRVELNYLRNLLEKYQ